MDTLVDPVEILSSSRMLVAAAIDPTRGSFPTIDPEAQVQWFSRTAEQEALRSIEAPRQAELVKTPHPGLASGLAREHDPSWEEYSDTDPTLVVHFVPTQRFGPP